MSGVLNVISSYKAAAGSASFTSVITSSVKQGGANGMTTDALDTTGCNLIVLDVTYYTGSAAPTISDSKGNTWTALTARTGGVPATRQYYCINPTVGTGHTFTCSGTSSFSSICATCATSTGTPSFDTQNGAALGSLTSAQPGSVTPSVDGCLIVTGLNCWTGNATPTLSINSSFTIGSYQTYAGSVDFGGGQAYLIQTTAAAVNPTWSWTGASSETTLTIGVYKP